MNFKFSAKPCYRKPNNTKYFAIQLVVDGCVIENDRDIAEYFKLTTKVYRNILRKFNAKMKFEKDTNIVFETIEELYEATKHLEQKFNENKSVKFRRTETGEGYIYGECTNEFIEPYKNLVPTITFEEIFANSLNKIKTDWNLICKYFMLDETFMDECPAEKLNWNLISRYQNMSLDFIKEHKDNLKLDILSLNVKLSQEIKDEVLKMIPKAPTKPQTSSDVGKEILGQMLGLNEEQLSKIGQVIQIGGPDEDDEIKL